MFFSSHTIVESVWIQRNFDTHITSQMLSCEIENPLVKVIKTLRNFGQICEFEKPVKFSFGKCYSCTFSLS